MANHMGIEAADQAASAAGAAGSALEGQQWGQATNPLVPRLTDIEVEELAMPVDLGAPHTWPPGFVPGPAVASWLELCAELDATLVVWRDGVSGLVSNEPRADGLMTLASVYARGRAVLEMAVLQYSGTAFANA